MNVFVSVATYADDATLWSPISCFYGQPSAMQIESFKKRSILLAAMNASKVRQVKRTTKLSITKAATLTKIEYGLLRFS